jgi:CRP-like cAMP-binding protein
MNDFQKMEADVESHIRDGNKEAAVASLYELIVAYSKQKNFSKAEALRERLYEVDPMALSEIVKAGEIIEQEKVESRDSDHTNIWSELYSVLSTEEANSLYYSLKPNSFSTDELIFSEGDKSWSLFFIDSGEIKMIYSRGKREFLLKTLGPGDTFGEETFFSRTAFCTFAAITLSPVRLKALDRSVLRGWAEDFPGLEDKLHDFCFRHGSMQELYEKQGVNRRTQRRINMAGNLVVQLIDPKGKPTGRPFKGSFSDISAGGLAFLVRVSKSDTARLLLGRRLVLKFILPLQSGKKEMQKSGRIIAVQPHIFSDYSIHVRFKEGLEEALVDNIVEAAKAEGPKLELELED